LSASQGEPSPSSACSSSTAVPQPLTPQPSPPPPSRNLSPPLVPATGAAAEHGEGDERYYSLLNS
jgi:hypothetical protein